MSRILPWRVQEVTTSGFGGTGNVLLDGVPASPAGRVSFSSGVGNGNSSLFMVDDGIGNWEITRGTLDTTGSPHELTRLATPIASSTGSKINFSAGVKDVVAITQDYGWTTLDTFDVTAVSSVDLTEAIDSTYDHYMVRFFELTLATDNISLQLQVSTDGGSSFKSGASDYLVHEVEQLSSSSGVLAGTNGAASAISLGLAMGNASGEGAAAGEILFSNPAGTVLAPVFTGWMTFRHQGAGALDYSRFTGTYDTVGAINALRLQASIGNISTMKGALMGLRD